MTWLDPAPLAFPGHEGDEVHQCETRIERAGRRPCHDLLLAWINRAEHKEHNKCSRSCDGPGPSAHRQENATLGHYLYEISEAELEPQIPTTQRMIGRNGRL